MRGQRNAPAAPYPRERPSTHCTGGWVVLRAGLDRCRKSRPPLGFHPRTIQPVGSHYTDYTTRPLVSYICMHGCMCVCVCVCVYIYIHTHTHTYMHTHTSLKDMFVWVICCMCVCVYIYIYIYTHTHTHIYIHTCTHTHTHITKGHVCMSHLLYVMTEICILRINSGGERTLFSIRVSKCPCFILLMRFIILVCAL